MKYTGAGVLDAAKTAVGLSLLGPPSYFVLIRSGTDLHGDCRRGWEHCEVLSESEGLRAGAAMAVAPAPSLWLLQKPL